MPQNIESLSNSAKLAFLAHLAHALTICSRETYEQGIDNVREPLVLRSYNEVLHRVTGAIVHRAVGTDGPSIEAVLEMVRDFGVRVNRATEVEWAVNHSRQQTLGNSTPG
jgi:hypothetical protein